MIETIYKNWRTSLVGVAVIALGIALVSGGVTVQQFLTAFSALTASGLMLSKDA